MVLEAVKFVFENIRIKKFLLITALFITFCSICLNYAYPLVYKSIIDRVARGETIDILSMVLILISITLLSHLLKLLSSYLLNVFRKTSSVDLQYSLYKKVINLNLKTFSNLKPNELVTGMLTDTKKMVSLLPDGLFLQTKEFVTILVGLVIIAKFSPILIPLFFIFFLIQILLSIKGGELMQRLESRMRFKLGEFMRIVMDPFYFFFIIKSYSAESYILKRFSESQKDILSLDIKKNLTSSFFNNFNSFLSGIFTITILIIGMVLIIERRMTPGTLFAIFIFSGIIQSSLKNIIKYYFILKSSIPSFKRVKDIFILEEENKEGVEIGDVVNKIEIKNLSFSYDGERDILKNISLSINRGERVAFVGRSGEGKSTIVKLLLGFYDDFRGDISINGIDIRKIKKDNLRTRFSYIPQEDYVVQGSIRDNLLIAKPDATTEELMEALSIAHLKEYIEGLKDGIDTHIKHARLFLSGGERQRLSIARGFLRRGDVIIFDETMSQIDSLHERDIMESMERLLREKTVIIIAHRISTVQRCNKIVVLHKGEISGMGTHEELYRGNPLYAQLCEMQVIK